MPPLNRPPTTPIACLRACRSQLTSLKWRLLACAAILTAVPLSVVGAPVVLPAQAAGASTTPASSITLVSQTAWVRNTKGMHLEVAIHSPVAESDLGLQVTLWSQATERGYFEESLTGDTAGFSTIPGDSVVLPLDTKALLLPNGDASIDLPLGPTQGVPGPTQKAPTNGILLTNLPCTFQCPGVYPLQVSLVDREKATTLDSFMTYLVLAPAAALSPLRFSWILPIGTTPATNPSGAPAVPPADELEVQQLDTALADRPSASVSIALYPQFTNALAAAGAVKTHATHSEKRKSASARQALADTRQLLALHNVESESESFTPIDLTGMSGAASEVRDQFAAGASALASLGVKPAKGQYAVAAPLSDSELPALRSNGIDRIVVPSDSVTPVPQSWVFPVWAPFLVKGTDMVADASDYYLEQHLESSSDPVLRANQLLADLALLYFVEQPPGNRGVTLLAPLGWHPSTQFLGTVLSGLSSSPVVQSDTLSQFFDQVPPGSDESGLLFRGLQASPTPREDRLPTAAIAGARTRLVALSGLLPKEPGRIEQLTELLLLSETALIPMSTRSAYLGAPAAQLNIEASRISLPSDKTITITSLSARIPVSIYSKALTPLRVELELSSAELSFRHRDLELVLQPGNNSIPVQLSARTGGDFEMLMTDTTQSGAFSLASGNLTIRSTAISGVAVALTVGAGLFLVVWWARSVLKRRRHGKHVRTGTQPRAPATPDIAPPITAT